MQTSELSEQVFATKLASNPLAVTELEKIYSRLQADPYLVGNLLRSDQDGTQHWIYETPRTGGARLRVYYTTRDYVVSIMVLGQL